MFENFIGSKKKINNFFTAASMFGNRANKTIGTTPVEDISSGTTTMSDSNAVSDRSVKLTITRDDAGCKYAFDNDGAVFNAIIRKDGIINNGIKVVFNEGVNQNNKRAKAAKKFLEERNKQVKLGNRVSSMIRNRSCYGFSVTKKIVNTKGDVLGLVDISSDECTPIRNLATGELGGPAGLGLDNKRKTKEVAMIQEGHRVIYTDRGGSATVDEWFYFIKEEIIAIGNNDRGMFKGVSDVMRALRYVEIKKTLENVVDLLARRFGPQVWVTVGNEHTNLSNTDIPASYLRDTDGNPIDPATARKNFKTDAMTALNLQIQTWVDGDSLVQLAEYGIKADVINPSSSTFDYEKYINLMADTIKATLLGLDTPGRVDVTSGIMQDKLTRDVRDTAIRERKMYMETLNEDYAEPSLKANNFVNLVHLEFEELDMTDEELNAKIEKIKSDAIYNYTKGGWTDLPEYLKKMWDITEEDIAKIISLDEIKEEETKEDDNVDDNTINNPKKTEKKDKKENPVIKRRKDDMNRGR